jgi:hypothetical protein
MSILNQGKTLESLSNVNISDINNDDILFYNASDKTWENKAISISGQSIDDLSDVTTTTPSNGDMLQFNRTN